MARHQYRSTALCSQQSLGGLQLVTEQQDIDTLPLLPLGSVGCLDDVLDDQTDGSVRVVCNGPTAASPTRIKASAVWENWRAVFLPKRDPSRLTPALLAMHNRQYAGPGHAYQLGAAQRLSHASGMLASARRHSAEDASIPRAATIPRSQTAPAAAAAAAATVAAACGSASSSAATAAGTIGLYSLVGEAYSSRLYHISEVQPAKPGSKTANKPATGHVGSMQGNPPAQVANPPSPRGGGFRLLVRSATITVAAAAPAAMAPAAVGSKPLPREATIHSGTYGHVPAFAPVAGIAYKALRRGTSSSAAAAALAMQQLRQAEAEVVESAAAAATPFPAAAPKTAALAPASSSASGAAAAACYIKHTGNTVQQPWDTTATSCHLAVGAGTTAISTCAKPTSGAAVLPRSITTSPAIATAAAAIAAAAAAVHAGHRLQSTSNVRCSSSGRQLPQLSVAGTCMHKPCNQQGVGAVVTFDGLQSKAGLHDGACATAAAPTSCELYTSSSSLNSVDFVLDSAASAETMHGPVVSDNSSCSGSSVASSRKVACSASSVHLAALAKPAVCSGWDSS